MTYPFKAPDGSTVRQVKFTATGKGGFICHIDVLSDSRPYNCFCLEKVEASPRWLDTGQVETDFEKTGPLGQVYDGAMQQSTSGGEEITINGHWTPVGINIDPAKRVPLILHTTRNWVKFNADGSITYRGVFQDGTYYSINKTATDQQGKPWAPNILNYQNQYNSNQSASTDFEFWLYSLKAYCWFE
jgi:hypothetical protein